jgi:thiamine pyrophosphate-dependent acetolactate synthase large subunit-like protein
MLIDPLRAQGVERVYCAPGESYLAARDVLYDSGVETVVRRQEAGAAMTALTVGRLAGRPGVAFERALRSGKPSILHLKVDSEAIAPGRTLSAMREAALKQRAGP